jgi:hypothetical protein
MLFNSAKRSDRCLSQADSAVIRWHHLVCPYPQALVLKQTLQVLQEQLILENAS